MTKEQEDSIEILENTDISTIELAENTDLYTYSLAVRTVLNMLKEKDAEIEKKDRQLEERNNRIRNLEKEAQTYFDGMADLNVELEKYKRLYNKALNDAVITAHDNMKKDRIIDLYIDELVSNEFDRCCQECCRECEKDKDTLRTCIKQYFERKQKKIR